jgi:hypothetical protein
MLKASLSDYPGPRLSWYVIQYVAPPERWVSTSRTALGLGHVKSGSCRLVERPRLVTGLVFKTSGVARERRSGGSIPLLYRGRSSRSCNETGGANEELSLGHWSAVQAALSNA